MNRILILIACLAFNLTVYTQNIHRTACNGGVAQLDSLLNHNSIEVQDRRGRSLLHWAVACKQKEVFDLLISKGISINTRDHQGKTPMHVAVQYDNSEYLGYLVEAQTKSDWQSNFGASLLEVAVLNNYQSLIEELVSYGVGINDTNSRGSTALEIAQRIGSTDVYELLLTLGADITMVREFKMEGVYMGQVVPDTNSKMFAPNFISSEEQEFGSVFNKEGNEFYFGVDTGGRNEIRFSQMIDNKWTKPITIVSHERYSYNDPFLSNDENRLYFISKRALDGVGPIKDVDIWYAERSGDGWSDPINAGSQINTDGDEYYISFTDEGTMYFASNGHARKDTSRTDHDIYYSKFINNEFQAPVLLGNNVNTKSYEADVFVAPDESYIIFCSTRVGGFGIGDLYISFKGSQGHWTQAINMGKNVNTKHYEYCPFVTKDGKYLFYTSNQDIYWVSTELIEELRNSIK